MDNKPKRKSGLKKRTGDLFNSNEDIDFTEFINPYLDFQKEYYKIASKSIDMDKAYIVTFADNSSLLYVSFAKNKDKAKSEATKYFRDSFYPTFMGTEWKKRYNEGRTKRKPEWDMYFKTKKVPIVELMRIGAKFPCSCCGNHNFSLYDYENKVCFVLEDEGNLNPFTKGFVLCYDCYRKLVK